MIKYEDLTGRRFGRLTVLGLAPSFVTPKGKKQIAWKVKCDCGTEKNVRGCDLRSGHIVSCGCYNKTKDIGKKQYKDITGQKFGRLTVQSYAYTKKNVAYWNCICDCGNVGVFKGASLKNGDTRSCGCIAASGDTNNMVVDITGQRFGRLTAQYVSSNRPRKWHCLCDCGNTVDILTSCLLSGHTQSCGCYQKDMVRQKQSVDMVGKRIGKLVVESMNEQRKGSILWNCLCDCGNRVVVRGHDLRTENTKSCGCMLSGTEIMIASFMRDHNIEFQQQKIFLGCRDIGPLRFDFYIPSMNLAIEYDGELHYMETTLNNDLDGQKRRDDIKTKYCEENDIILLRIPYWEKDNIESILSDWLFLNDAEEANSSGVDLSA